MKAMSPGIRKFALTAHVTSSVQLVADAGAALVALLIATTLSVYKPRGLTP